MRITITRTHVNRKHEICAKTYQKNEERCCKIIDGCGTRIRCRYFSNKIYDSCESSTDILYKKIITLRFFGIARA